MSREVRLYNLAPSPNNMKARLALGYKEIPHRRIPVDPFDRSEVVRISGQPLTPVLVHGDAVIFDSAAIVRYLDANFPRTPRLFSPDREIMKQIEEYEHWARHEPAEGVRMVFSQVFREHPDLDVVRRACEPLAAAAARLEEALDGHAYLVGDSLSAADIFVAPLIGFSMLPEDYTRDFPRARLFPEHYRLPPGHERVRSWVRRVMAHDRPVE